MWSTIPRAIARPVALVLLAGAPLAAPAPATAAERPARSTLVEERSGAVEDRRTFRLSRAATHVAVHWRGARAAHVDVQLSRDGRSFGPPRHVELDEVGLRARPGETYGQVLVARGVTAVRVLADRPLRRVTVLGLRDRGRPRETAATATATAAHTGAPAIVSRAGWGADERLRFDRRGAEIWPPAYHDVQKVVVHHTAGRNDDPDPAATLRSIYHYHAVTQGWGDIGYTFLVDEAGRVYEGRSSGEDGIPGEDAGLLGVTAAHAYGYNAGTIGVALLGTLTSQDAASAARTTLEELLAWSTERHGLDPLGASTYTNPVTGTATAGLPAVLGHRDVAATECPGEILHGTLAQLREATALRRQAGALPAFAVQPSTAELDLVRGKAIGEVELAIPADPALTGPIALAADGLPAAAEVTFTHPAVAGGGASLVTVTTTRRTPAGSFLLRLEGTWVDAATGLRQTRAATVRVRIRR